MTIRKGSRTQRNERAAWNCANRRRGADRAKARREIGHQADAISAGIRALLVALACLFAISTEIAAQGTPETMTVPPATYPPAAPTMGAPPIAPESVGPHISYTA